MSISAAQVKELRERTGAGMLNCKNALVEVDGDIEKAVDLLREKGLSQAAKKSSRIAAEGLVDSYIHGGRIGVLIEVNTETDFVAKNAEFKKFVRDLAMQVAASNPKYISIEDVPEEDVNREKEVLIHQVINEGKPEHVAEKIVEGRLGKFYEQVCLLEQSLIRRFERYEVGEGLEKREEDFAEEVAKQMKM